MTQGRMQNRFGPNGMGDRIWDRAGFTLFEMLVVLVIMSLSVALVVPRLAGSLTKMNARAAAGKIAGSLRYARSQAVVEQIPYRSDFDLIEHRLTVRPRRSNSANRIPAEVKSVSYELPDGIRLEIDPEVAERIHAQGEYSIWFFPTGGSSGGGIIIRDEENRTFTLSVDLITGAVQLNE